MMEGSAEKTAEPSVPPEPEALPTATLNDMVKETDEASEALVETEVLPAVEEAVETATQATKE